MLTLPSIGCGGSDMMTSQCTKDAAGSMTYKYVTNAIILPVGSMSFSTDVDGDGKKDNQLKALTGPISAMIDLNKSLAESVAKGEALLGMTIKANSLTDSCTGVTLAALDKPMTAPKFDGTDVLKVGNAQQANLFGGVGPSAGQIVDPTDSKGMRMITNPNGQLYTVAPPKQQAADVQKITISVALSQDAPPLELAISGAHVQGTLSADGKEIKAGELHGVISKKDVDGKIIPSVAGLLTNLIHKGGNTAKTLISIFEDSSLQVTKDKCMTESKCCAKKPDTCEILPEEVAQNPLIGMFLKADVKTFDSDGVTWKPQAGAPEAERNGMSVGIGFTGYKASF